MSDVKMTDLAVPGEIMKTWMKDRPALHQKRAPKKRKWKSKFKPGFVKLPIPWIERLEAADGVTVGTFKLAHRILIEKFKFDQMVVTEIVLSQQVTGLPRRVRARAIYILVKLGLIKVKRRAQAAPRVISLFFLEG
jgi:hypothetical protein